MPARSDSGPGIVADAGDADEEIHVPHHLAEDEPRDLFQRAGLPERIEKSVRDMIGGKSTAPGMGSAKSTSDVAMAAPESVDTKSRESEPAE